MNDPLVSIIMRSYNEAWALKDTLAALRLQEYTHWELIVIDSGSTDGSHELIRAAAPEHFIQITPAEYNPSRVMNQGMQLARAEICIFLNADATPQGPNWLRPLVEALKNPETAACFGRQIPRPDCQAAFACDYDRCFGPRRDSARWDHFFSMVSSGLRKDVWSRRGFREDLQYAEDDEYTRWARQQGYEVRYVPESIAMHSHNYLPEQSYRRAYGDARAIGQAWQGAPDAFSWPRTVLLGWLSDIRHDIRFCLKQARWRELGAAALIRWQQRRGKLAGFRQGYGESRQPRGVGNLQHAP
jgi:rhamnosyltransferase